MGIQTLVAVRVYKRRGAGVQACSQQVWCKFGWGSWRCLYISLMRLFIGLVFGVTAWAMSPAASAQSAEAQDAYQAGSYEHALGLALEEATSDSLAFAARAVLAGGIGTDPIDMSDERLDEAQKLAERAMALDSGHDEARLQQAIVLSLRARAMGARPAFRARLGRRARALGEAVAEESPDNPYAHGFLAVWHVEVIRRGGRIGALVLGASMDEAREHYAIASELAPSDLALHWQWVRALSALNPSKYASEIEAALIRVENAIPADQLSTVLQARALRFRDASVNLSAGEIRRLAVALL